MGEYVARELTRDEMGNIAADLGVIASYVALHGWTWQANEMARELLADIHAIVNGEPFPATEAVTP